MQNKYVVCPACGGDGKETCNNPDHGFISSMSGVRSDKYDTGRLGCPVCGHHPRHKVSGGRSCFECNGTGKMEHEYAITWCQENDFDDELIEIT